MLKYKCLVLDHDDTVVDSTASIHYPSFLAYVAEYRPHLLENYDRDTFYRKNFDPGIFAIGDTITVPRYLRDFPR